MSKAKKSYKDLCKELQLLQDQQKNMVEAGAKVFLSELTSQDEMIKKFLADAKPAEIKQKAIEVAPVLLRSINSTGVNTLKDRVNRYYFDAGMDSMMETLEPDIVLVYSKMPDEIKGRYPGTKFVEYPDWTSIMREDT